MPNTYQQSEVRKRFSTTYPTRVNGMVMDVATDDGFINDKALFGGKGSGTTDATVGTTVAIAHNLNVVPDLADIQITETSDGTVYLDTANPPTKTTFNVKGSAASLTFVWKIITNGPAS